MRMTDLETSNLVIWPKWCYSNSQMEIEAKDLVINNNNNNDSNHNNNNKNNKTAFNKDSVINNNNNYSVNNNNSKEKDTSPIRNRKKYRRDSPTYGLKQASYPVNASNGMLSDASGHVKAERLSPDPPAATDNSNTIRHTSPTPSTSPKSPASHRTRTPSFAGTPPNPTFTPPGTTLHSPYDRFSPAALGAMGGLPGTHGTMKQMESIMTRNCSDLMRSLAAKYNNNNPNDYFSNPNNGFLRAPLSNIPPFKGAPSPFIGVSSPSVTSAPSIRETEKKIDVPVSTVTAGLSPGIPSGNPHLFPGPGIPGFPGFPLVDMSSTQVLLNMVRNASAAQQSQLENYLRGAMKRPADAPPPTSPLDLSSSVATKRPRTEAPRSFDVKNLFPVTTDEDTKREEKIHVSPDTSLSITKTRSSPSTPGKCFSAAIPCTDRDCPSMEAILHWTVEDVCNFVGSIDLCAEYVEAFRDQRIDGSALPLLTEEHLTSSINMKLGPALKLRSVLARKLGTCGICLHCAHCHSSPTERRPNSASSGQ